MEEMLRECSAFGGQEQGVVSRFNGHFLYNTLETIRMMASEHEETAIEEMIKDLGRVLRGNLEVRKELVSLKSEIKLVESYLRIQDQRFGDRIRHEIHVECPLDGICILPLMMQPLVENAYQYGVIEKMGAESVVKVTVRRGETLQIIIEDNGMGMDPDKVQRIIKEMNEEKEFNENEIGLKTIHRRIQERFGKEYGITLHSKKMQGTKVVVDLPA